MKHKHQLINNETATDGSWNLTAATNFSSQVVCCVHQGLTR